MGFTKTGVIIIIISALIQLIIIKYIDNVLGLAVGLTINISFIVFWFKVKNKKRYDF